MLKSVVFLVCLTAGCATHASVEYRFVTDQPVYDVVAGTTFPMSVFLEERVTGASQSTLEAQYGLFSVGVRIQQSGTSPTHPSRLQATPLPALNTADFWDYNEGAFAASAEVNALANTASIYVFARNQGVVGQSAGIGIRRVFIATINVVAGIDPATTTSFDLRDPVLSQDSLTWSSGIVIDPQIFPTTIQIRTRPVCDSIDFNQDGSIFDPQDIEAFLSVYSEGPCIPSTASCNDIDFNNDGSVFDPIDIGSFLSRYSEGPCFF